jgi:pSer/pThr/pTyr-binding forkhead associated (FHA) protein
MDDEVLSLLRLGMLGLLYLFFGRIMWTVWTEVRVAPVTAGTLTTRVGRLPSLTIVEPAQLAGRLDLSTGVITIGRHPDCDLTLPDDAFVSQRHLRIGRNATSLWVEDLGSTNGTLVDGRPLTQRLVVTPGMRIEAGGLVMEAS